MQAASRKSEITRQAILDAAHDFLESQAFRDLSVAGLMERVGASRPTFYQYFADLSALTECLLGDLRDEFDQATTDWFGAPADPRAALQATLEVVATGLYRRGPLVRAVVEAAPTDARLSGEWEAFVWRYDKAAAASIARDQAVGLVGPMDTVMVAQALNRMNISFTIQHFGQRPRTQLRRVLPTLTHIWLSTIYGEAP